MIIAAGEDHRRRRSRDGLATCVQLLARCRPIGSHAADTNARLPLPLAYVKYICESCGFIYDPAEGDPDGGIPPGTQFEDIPDTWFCPVCGARKRDFSPYDG